MPSYFPGCALESSARDYDIATRAVCAALGIPLAELPGWNCCGSIPVRSVDENVFHALNARNLHLAEREGQELALPCAICYNALKRTQYEMAKSPERKAAIEQLAGVAVQGTVAVRHIIEVLVPFLETIPARMARHLSSLKVACYYGCLLVRPSAAMQFDDPENPQALDRIVEALGAKPMDWAGKTDCCGGYLSVTRPETCIKMKGHLLRAAHESGANVVVVACPVCHSNLDVKQEEIWQDQGPSLSIPIFYITELVGLALGLPDAARAVKMHMTPVERVIAV